MEGLFMVGLALAANVRNHAQTELHLSTLGGLHVIDAAERDRGNVFQCTLPGRWGRNGVFHVATGERLKIDADGRARWIGDDRPPLKPYRWGRVG
jgi:hypothetical protein